MVCVRFLRTQQRVKSQCLVHLECLGCPSCPDLFLGGGFFEASAHLLCGGVFLLGLSLRFGGPALEWGCLLALMESLILAQDERWRRA